MAMVRRRMKTKDLKFEIMTLGDKSRTDIALCYMEHSVDSDILEKVRKRLLRLKSTPFSIRAISCPFSTQRLRLFFRRWG